MIVFSFIPITSMLLKYTITSSMYITMYIYCIYIEEERRKRRRKKKICLKLTLHFFPFFPLIAMIITEKTVGFHAGRKTSLTSMNAMCQLAQFRPDMVSEFIKAMIDTINQPAVKTTKGEVVLVAPKA